MKNTKIIATIGPATNNEEKVIELYNAGINVIRFNFSHANYEEAGRNIELIKRLNKEGKTNLSLLLDTKGPEIRTGDLAEKNTYEAGEIFKVYVDPSKELTEKALFCDYPYLIEDIELGGYINIDSGLMNVEVLEKQEDCVVVKALNSAVIWNRRHINLPGVRLKLPGITEKDIKDIEFAIENDFAFIAASFIRSASNVQEIRDLFAKHNCNTIKIISKIENEEGIENIDEVIEASDGIMVARGDLGIEVPIQKLAIYQKEIVEKCNKKGKIVITATHLLETMIDNPFPTRAESSDVFNAVLQKCDSLMLSGETAIGKFPIEAVKMMTSLINEAETVVDYDFADFEYSDTNEKVLEKKELLKGAIMAADKLGAKAMLIMTRSGRLAKLASNFRPNVPVFAFAPTEQVVRNINLNYGIYPAVLNTWEDYNCTKNLDDAIELLLNNGSITREDKIVVINNIRRGNQEISSTEIINLKEY